MSRIIPLVLNNALATDGEHNFLLAAYSLEPGEPSILPEGAALPLPFRRSRMKASFIWQNDAAKFSAMFVVRSPFTQGLFGSPADQIATLAQAAPIITLTPYGYSDDPVVYWADTLDPSAVSPDVWPTVGLPDPILGAFVSFNDKPIPCWAFVVTISGAGPEDDEPVQLGITVDFSHSIT